MTTANLPNGIELEYDTFGSRTDPTLLLVMGFGSQMILWDDRFCQLLADRGRHVVRFDNRDVGLSSKLDDHPVDAMAVMTAALQGAPLPPVPYDLADMAADAVGLLDVLGVDRAHAVGASMGGMIVQMMAIGHGDRLLSATSIMSTVGDPAYGAPSSEAMAVLLSPPPASRDEAVERAVQGAVWGSKRHYDPDAVRRVAAASWDRGVHPPGIARQLAAIFATGDRTGALRAVSVPMLVVHGLDDTLIDPSGGRRTAELVPGAHLLEVADMGHDLPQPLWPMLTATIAGFGDAAVAVAGRPEAAA